MRTTGTRIAAWAATSLSMARLLCAGRAQADAPSPGPPARSAGATPQASAPAPRDPHLAQLLFEEGRAKMEAGQLDRACTMLGESQRLDPGGGTILNLALCHEKQGRVATAWAEYQEGLRIGTSDARDDRVEFARERIHALQGRLPSLLIRVPEPAIEGLELRLDGERLAGTAAGSAAPIDPGMHEVRAVAPGRTAWSAPVFIAAEAHQEVRVPELARTGEGPLGGAKTSLVLGTYVAGGVALTAFGAAVISGVMALGAESDAHAKCIDARRFCPDPSGNDDATRTRALAWVSTGALGVGIVATAVAVLWPRNRTSEPRAGLMATPLIGGGAVIATGSF